MTDSKIVKALECCVNCECSGCPCRPIEDERCFGVDNNLILSLINHQKAEIERLTRRLDMSRKELLERRERNIQNSKLTLNLLSELKIAKSEAIREFAERLNVKAVCNVVHLNDIAHLVKEMTREYNE